MAGALVYLITVEFVAVLAVPSIVANASGANAGPRVLAKLIATLALLAYDTIELAAWHVIIHNAADQVKRSTL